MYLFQFSGCFDYRMYYTLYQNVQYVTRLSTGVYGVFFGGSVAFPLLSFLSTLFLTLAIRRNYNKDVFDHQITISKYVDMMNLHFAFLSVKDKGKNNSLDKGIWD